MMHLGGRSQVERSLNILASVFLESNSAASEHIPAAPAASSLRNGVRGYMPALLRYAHPLGEEIRER